MMWCRVDRVVIRDAARRRGFRPDCGAPSLSDCTARVTGGKWGKLMYCGAVEFVCSPSAVSHIPVLLDECMGYLNPCGEAFLLTLPLVGEGTVVRFSKLVQPQGCLPWTVTRMQGAG